MSKTISVGMQAHLDGEVTSLATCWQITRQDGVEFFFTDHDTQLLIAGDVFKPDSGYKRTAIANDSTLAVDNLDIEGVFDDDEITEQDLRAGKFDYAEIRIFTVNWADLTDGIIRMRRGRIGEVGLTEQGVFRAELRGLTQQLSQRVGEAYQPECRADLGDERCTIPIDPPVREDSKAYFVGDFIKVSTAIPNTRFLTHADVDGEDLVTTNVPTYGAKVALQGTTVKYGAQANEHSPTVTDDVPSLVIYPDDPLYSIGGADFCVEGYFNFKSLPTAAGLFGYFDGTDGWFVRYLSALGGTLEFNSFNGAAIEIVVSGAVSLVTGTWYHIAVSRDRSGPDTFRIFVDGVEEVTETGNTETVLSPASDGFVLGGVGESVSNVRSFDGYSDECRLTIGEPVYTAGFTPLSAPFPDPGTGGDETQSQYENRIYENVVAGTTAATQPTYDTTVGNTTVDGTAEFDAVEAWMRDGTVDTVTDRMSFTLTSDFDEVRAVDDWFNGGGLQFESGENEGRTIEIRDWIQSSRTIELFLPASFTIQPGDKVRLYPGCDKLLSTCRDRFDNVINFRGFPHVPGQDEYTKYPDAKTA